jgi:hypothetical protein
MLVVRVGQILHLGNRKSRVELLSEVPEGTLHADANGSIPGEHGAAFGSDEAPPSGPTLPPSEPGVREALRELDGAA